MVMTPQQIMLLTAGPVVPPNPLLTGIAAFINKIVEVVKLLWSGIVDWFQGFFSKFFQQRKLNKKDGETIEEILGDPENREKAVHINLFSLDMGTEGKKKIFAQGAYNTKTEKLEDGVKYVAEKIDETLEKHHREDKLVIYNF